MGEPCSTYGRDDKCIHKGRDHLGKLRVYGKIPMKWIIMKQGVKVWTGFSWLRRGFSGVLFSTHNKLSGSTTGGSFLTSFSRSLLHGDKFVIV
jgi:hypothetical protein